MNACPLRNISREVNNLKGTSSSIYKMFLTSQFEASGHFTWPGSSATKTDNPWPLIHHVLGFLSMLPLYQRIPTSCI